MVSGNVPGWDYGHELLTALAGLKLHGCRCKSCGDLLGFTYWRRNSGDWDIRVACPRNSLHTIGYTIVDETWKVAVQKHTEQERLAFLLALLKPYMVVTEQVKEKVTPLPDRKKEAPW